MGGVPTVGIFDVANVDTFSATGSPNFLMSLVNKPCKNLTESGPATRMTVRDLSREATGPTSSRWVEKNLRVWRLRSESLNRDISGCLLIAEQKIREKKMGGFWRKERESAAAGEEREGGDTWGLGTSGS